MRKITKEIVNAWNNGKSCCRGNTMTDGETIWLHGNAIIKREDGSVFVRTAGRNTLTTRERLNSVAKVRQHKGKLYLFDKLWINHEDWTLAKESPKGSLVIFKEMVV